MAHRELRTSRPPGGVLRASVDTTMAGSTIGGKAEDRRPMTDEICHHGMCYQKLTSGNYKYKLAKDYQYETDIVGRGGDVLPYLSIDSGGKLLIFHRYAWDGPSGPSIDTKNFIRGSLVHDALYQLMRERILDHTKDRKRADQLLRDICRVDGMSRFRAWYVYRLLRIFGGPAANPED